MRIWFLAMPVLGLLAACGNTYHPDYHPQTSLDYRVTSSNPVVVNTRAANGAAAPPAATPPPQEVWFP